MDRCVWRKDDMGRGRTGTALIGAAVALMVGGSVASAGPDPSVPEPSVPETSAPETSAPEPTIPVETSIPPTEPSVSADSETYTLTIMLPDGWPSVDPSFITVGVVADGATDDDADHVAGPMACEAFAPCAVFELAPGEYDLRIDVEQTNPEASLGVLPALDSDIGYDVTIVDRDLVARFDFVATAAPPLPPSTSSTTSTVAAAGPVPVAELPETGSNGRLGVASLLLITVGFGCVAAARRRPA